jgi:hypothetical protein
VWSGPADHEAAYSVLRLVDGKDLPGVPKVESRNGQQTSALSVVPAFVS